jgi:Holliday junction resolvase-like predicted endonuclease
MDAETLVFVEVKSRKRMGDERYDELVSPAKQRSVLAAGFQYMAEMRYSGPFRFDVLFVIGEGKYARMDHIENAFDSWV